MQGSAYLQQVREAQINDKKEEPIRGADSLTHPAVRDIK